MLMENTVPGSAATKCSGVCEGDMLVGTSFLDEESCFASWAKVVSKDLPTEGLLHA